MKIYALPGTLPCNQCNNTEGIADPKPGGGTSGLNAYPNPFNNIVSAQVLVTNSGIKEIQIFDVLGRLTVDKDFNNTSVNLQTMNVSVLPQGLYFIKVTMNTGEQYSQKIIKQ